MIEIQDQTKNFYLTLKSKTNKADFEGFDWRGTMFSLLFPIIVDELYKWSTKAKTNELVDDYDDLWKMDEQILEFLRDNDIDLDSFFKAVRKRINKEAQKYYE